MADLTVVSANTRALTSHGAVVVPGIAGATVTIGYAVYQNSDGEWEHADANAVGLQTALGVAVESYDGEDTVAEGNALSVCTVGPIGGYTDVTAGALYYLSNTVGRISDAEGAYDRILGNGMYLAGQKVLNLNIQLTDAASD